MVERLLVAFAAVLAPLLGSGVATSRRKRLLSRIRAYNTLADELEAHNPEKASSVRELVAELAERLVTQERAALARRFEVAGIFALALFLAPAVVGSFFAWTHRGWWTWPVLIVSASWAGIVLAATWDQIWTEKEHEGEPQAEDG